MNKMCRTNAQGGRSMIEMLGVLAIIGVLSVGGIAGYSKAMTKYRINKTIDQITQISQNIRILYGRQRQKNYRNLNERILYKANLAPKEMFGSGYSMTNAWGEFFIATKYSDDMVTYFNIVTEIPSEEACIELATHDWGSRDTTGLNSVVIFDGGETPLEHHDLVGNCSGKIGNGFTGALAVACSGGANISIPMPVDVAVDVCSSNAPYNSLVLTYE